MSLYGKTEGTQNSQLGFLAVEVSYGAQWVDLNDGEKFKIAAEGTRDATAKTWRK